jgi:transposase
MFFIKKFVCFKKYNITSNKNKGYKKEIQGNEQIKLITGNYLASNERLIITVIHTWQKRQRTVFQ